MLVLLAVVSMAALLWAGVSLLGVLYPFKPFHTRKRALRSLGGSLAISLASLLFVGFNAESKPKTASELAATPSASSPEVAVEGDRAAAAPVEPTSSPGLDQASTEVETSVQVSTNACSGGTALPGDVVAVSGEYALHVEPDESSARIKNEKASKILGEAHYHQIDKSTTVRRLCVKGDWTEVQIVTPEWLTFVKGWVPNAALRGIEHSGDGARVFVEEDFYWDDSTSRFKAEIVAVVNKIARENANCPNPDPGTVSKSADRSKPNDPVFFVMCGEGTDVFNVWFKPGDASGDTTFEAVLPLSQTAAVDACEVVAKSAATHPSTVDFSRFVDLSYFAHKNGNVRVTSTFTAKNALNLELKYDIYCFFEGNKLVEHSIAEALQ